MKFSKFLFLGGIFLLGHLILTIGSKISVNLLLFSSLFFFGLVIFNYKPNYFVGGFLYIKFRILIWYRDSIGIGCIRDNKIQGFKEIVYYDIITLKKYKVVFPKKRGSSPINQFQDLESQQLINSQEIEEIMGFGGYFHSIPTTGEMLGINNDFQILLNNEEKVVCSPNKIIS